MKTLLFLFSLLLLASCGNVARSRTLQEAAKQANKGEALNAETKIVKCSPEILIKKAYKEVLKIATKDGTLEVDKIYSNKSMEAYSYTGVGEERFMDFTFFIEIDDDKHIYNSHYNLGTCENISTTSSRAQEVTAEGTQL